MISGKSMKSNFGGSCCGQVMISHDNWEIGDAVRNELGGMGTHRRKSMPSLVKERQVAANKQPERVRMSETKQSLRNVFYPYAPVRIAS